MKPRIVIAAIAAAAAVSIGLPAQAATPPKPDKVAVCTSCHGETGTSIGPTFPDLAGQQDTYIEHALHAYQSGERKNPIMSAQATGLTDADIKSLALWYSSQKPNVYVPDIEDESKAARK
jgi:cytochrome c553